MLLIVARNKNISCLFPYCNGKIKAKINNDKRHSYILYVIPIYTSILLARIIYTCYLLLLLLLLSHCSLTPWVHLTTKTRHALVLPTRTYIRLRVMNRQISEQNIFRISIMKNRLKFLIKFSNISIKF